MEKTSFKDKASMSSPVRAARSRIAKGWTDEEILIYLAPNPKAHEILARAKLPSSTPGKSHRINGKNASQIRFVENVVRGKAIATQDGWYTFDNLPDNIRIYLKEIPELAIDPKVLTELNELRTFRKRFDSLAFLDDKQIKRIAEILNSK